MNPITCRTYNSYTFGSCEKLTETQLEKMIECFSTSTPTLEDGLEGRTKVTKIHLDGIGPSVVKHYMRGGFIGKLNKRFYLKTGKPRPRVELEQLYRAGDVGISVPEPVCFAVRGTLFYRAWLVTKEIEHPQSLAQLATKDMKLAEPGLKKLIPQILLLLDNRIYHKDLHPGNVLIDKNNRIFIIDFDKAGLFRGDRQALLNIYLERWKRAVIKHNLPQEIYSILHKGFMK